jgi:anti-sigma B factor antagonist
MKFRTNQRGSVTIIAPEGSILGGPDAAELNKRVQELIGEGRTRIVIDLQDIGFMNSSGLGLLIGSASKLRDAGGKLAIANASRKVLDLIKVSKLTGVLETHPSVDDAIAHLKT